VACPVSSRRRGVLCSEKEKGGKKGTACGVVRDGQGGRRGKGRFSSSSLGGEKRDEGGAKGIRSRRGAICYLIRRQKKTRSRRPLVTDRKKANPWSPAGRKERKRKIRCADRPRAMKVRCTQRRRGKVRSGFSLCARIKARYDVAKRERRKKGIKRNRKTCAALSLSTKKQKKKKK